jgi:hypothetical protein
MLKVKDEEILKMRKEMNEFNRISKEEKKRLEVEKQNKENEIKKKTN